MPSQPSLHFSLPRWIGILCHKNSRQSETVERNSNLGGGGTANNIDDGNPVLNSTECYACTQVGVPAFHSTSCYQAHKPEWEASAGSSLVPIQNRTRLRKSTAGSLGTVLDPRSKRRAEMEPGFPIGTWHGSGRRSTVLLRFVSREKWGPLPVHGRWIGRRRDRPSLEPGCDPFVPPLFTVQLVWDARAIASRYARSLKGFWFDAFVILPVPQNELGCRSRDRHSLVLPMSMNGGFVSTIMGPPNNNGQEYHTLNHSRRLCTSVSAQACKAVFWLVVPKLIREDKIRLIMTILLLIFLFQFLPKVYHCLCLMRRMQKVTGYIFGTIWWGFGLNLIAYFIASHVAGGCWYVLTIQRVASCLRQSCESKPNCDLSLACSEEVCYQFLFPEGTIGNPCGGNSTNTVRMPMCLDVNGAFNYGIYNTFGNDLEPTSHWLEVIFSICIVLSGLMLFTLLIGNIQVFLHAVMAKKRKMQLRCRDMEWWMRRRQLPSCLRQRVRHFEQQRWETMGDLIKKVPLFHNLDDLILDNICDRVIPIVFSRDEKIIREGDPVQRMVFIVHGRIRSSQSLSKGMVATSVLEPGGFLGDELLSWCLRRPFIDRLPASAATFVCIESTEAFGLDAYHLQYITDHFRYRFTSERLKRTARYYSSNWRTWAAVNIQFAWRHYRMRTRGPVNPVPEKGGTERRLLQYAAMFMSIRPHDHLE
ncbi:CYCLIC NUCLEOTIDE-GATED ION CHANNEL 2-LIKE [Salix koriyanagi]|uniref:CYCLIC NUCLEOTIDE-GATED ION CHANNEL 2-LIKE n=1 Tax=Salix koriyanagi TaxID=2511006 RepID=A0A9Q0UYW2_9ROSI|nr:CYCLIC NUCLEOTIDE-GATED ION CHANNEL 2-LIKE [Salix koriyanagi]